MDLEKARVNDRELTYQIGRLTVTWASLEFSIDAMVWFIHTSMDGEKHEPEIPRALWRKIDYLSNAFKRLPIADADRPRYQQFVDDLKAESDVRHDIIHGFPVHHPSDEGEAKMIRLIFKKTHWDQKPVTISIESVAAASDRATDLAGKAAKWTTTMAELRDTILAQEQQHGGQPE